MLLGVANDNLAGDETTFSAGDWGGGRERPDYLEFVFFQTSPRSFELLASIYVRTTAATKANAGALKAPREGRAARYMQTSQNRTCPPKGGRYEGKPGAKRACAAELLRDGDCGRDASDEWRKSAKGTACRAPTKASAKGRSEGCVSNPHRIAFRMTAL